MKVRLNSKECNELIADFMKLKRSDDNGVITFNRHSKLVTSDKLRYHKSWDWLMEVIIWIENPLFACRNRNNMTFIVNITEDECEIFIGEFLDETFYRKSIKNSNENSYIDGEIVTFGSEGKLGKTYEAVVKFIKWYNNRPPIIKK